MTKSQFLKKMANLKASIEPMEDHTFGVCYLLSSYLSGRARRDFKEIYRPIGHTDAYWGAWDYTQTIQLSREDALVQRLNMILLFEQQALTYKLYKDW